MIAHSIPNLGGNEGAYLADCVSTNFVSSVGPYVDRFELSVCEVSGSESAVATSSGTAGLHLALWSAGVRPGDLVIVPSFTFVATANAVSLCGAAPWFMDVTEESWTLDANQLRRQLALFADSDGGSLIHKSTRRRVSAVVPVYTLGLPADMDPVTAVAEEFGLRVVADAAAALGATYKGRSIGNLAPVSVASFNGNKTFTCGGGGAIFGSDLSLLSHARHLSMTARVGPTYEHDEVAFNYRLTNLQAAVGVAQLEQRLTFLERKRAIDETYRRVGEEFAGVRGFPEPTWAESARWLSGLMLPAGRAVQAVVAALHERGVEARTFWKPLHLMRPYANSPRADLGYSEGLWERIMTLPSSTSLSDQELAVVTRALRDVLSA